MFEHIICHLFYQIMSQFVVSPAGSVVDVHSTCFTCDADSVQKKLWFVVLYHRYRTR